MPISSTITPRTRNLLVGWLAPIVLVLALLLIVWAAGGFRPAEDLAGPRARLGEQLELRRWTITVQRVALVDLAPEGYDQDPAFRVEATVTLTGRETVDLLPERLIEVRVPGGPRTDGFRLVGSDRGYAFDPDVPRDVLLDYPWPDWEKPPHLPAPEEVAIVVRDEQRSYNFVFGDELTVRDPAGVIVTAVDDQRKRS
jgi:hypothetical protein